MADPRDLRAAPMHEHDRRFNAVLGWSIAWSAIPASIFAGSILGLYTGQLSWQGALPSMAGSVAVMAVINFVGYKQKAPELKNPGPVMLFIALLTWCFVAWQTWMWFHPLVQPARPAQVQETKPQLDTATKPLRDQIEQLAKENESLRQGNADTIAKATAALRAQIAQLLSDAPVNVDKLPTSMRVLFKGTSVEQIDEKNVAAWSLLAAWSRPRALLVPEPPALAILLVFKKPITYDGVYVDDHGLGFGSSAEVTTNPRFAIVQFNSPYVTGLADIVVRNDHSK